MRLKGDVEARSSPFDELSEDLVQHGVLTSVAIDDVLDHLVALAFLFENLASILILNVRLETV